MLQPPRSGAYAYVPKQSDIKRGVHSTVQIATSWRDLSLPLQHAQMVRGDTQLLRRFGDVHIALHLRIVDIGV
jgi:hypothetical protein